MTHYVSLKTYQWTYPKMVANTFIELYAIRMGPIPMCDILQLK